MAKEPEWALVERAVALVEAGGVVVSEEVQVHLRTHVELVRKWNRVGSLVSAKDEQRLEQHVADSLSLVPYLESFSERLWLDIGPGGGFPVIPVALVLPKIAAVAVERSEKKAGLLAAMTRKLGLENIEVVWGEFPGAPSNETPWVVTARAVERPVRLFAGLAELVERGATYLCQTDPAWWQERAFHVEQVADQWANEGLRRSRLYRITT